jgi:ketosteroid isomerase-like protein
METVELELLRRGYAAVGLGAPRDLLRLFDQDAGEGGDDDLDGGGGEERGDLVARGRVPRGSDGPSCPRPDPGGMPAPRPDPGGPSGPRPDPGGMPARWCVQMLDSGTRYPAREVVADDLFGAVPAHWEVTGVEVECLLPYELTDGTLRVVARGTYRCRPRGSWDCYDLPFAHVWTFRGGHVQRVVCYLEGVELRRLAG